MKLPISMKRTRSIERPYQVRVKGDWVYKVLKSYHNDTSTPGARAFCAVQSPYTFGGWDYGDVYWTDLEHTILTDTYYK